MPKPNEPSENSTFFIMHDHYCSMMTGLNALKVTHNLWFDYIVNCVHHPGCLVVFGQKELK